MLKNVNVEEFKKIQAEEKLFVADFWATWCGPCKALTPILESVAEELAEIPFVKVDVDDNEELAREYNIMTVPSLLVFKNGELVDKSIGLISKEQLIALVHKHM